MSEKSIFTFSSYKSVMEHHLLGKGKHGRISRAADALKCQRSYLSRVMSEHIHLTPDHAFKLAEFLGFTADEREYFLTLVDHERAATPELRGYLKSRLTALKRRQESVQERVKRQTDTIETIQAGYFSNWIWTAVHFLTSIPRLQSAEALAEHLGLRVQTVLHYLENLRAQGLVEQHGKSWRYKGGQFHLPKESPLVVFHHQNWRTRAVLDAQDPHSQGVHFSVVQTVSSADAERIKVKMLDFIETASAIAGPSPPEEGIALTCDFFKL